MAFVSRPEGSEGHRHGRRACLAEEIASTNALREEHAWDVSGKAK